MKVCGKMIHSISGQEMWFQVPVDRKQPKIPKRVKKKRSRGDNNNGNKPSSEVSSMALVASSRVHSPYIDGSSWAWRATIQL